jgi:leucyl-tRNA synthetase
MIINMKKAIKSLQDTKKLEKYDSLTIEPKWQAKWEEERVYQPDLGSANQFTNNPSDKAQDARPFYNLMMFPYPSAEGMHVGNMYAFTGSDIYGRFKRMQGYVVFEPIGLDGFGIHSENYAIKVGRHPKEQAEISQKNFYRQLRATGNAFDWSRTVETYDPGYYKWTQWVFIQLFKAGLAYKKKADVNFCPSCKTVLADEQVIEGKCERCGSEVEKKALEQWFFRITNYADRLLANLDKLDWSEVVKVAQRQWIGKSEGAVVSFSLKQIKGQDDNKHRVEVFTTRPDTLFGATFLVISPELGKKWLEVGWKAPAPVIEYIENSLKKDQIARTDDKKAKTGVDTGILAVNPVNKKEIPVWVADYVLGGYGTGAIMAVPAHDTRDYAFAKKYGLTIREVISSSQGIEDGAYTGPGKLVNSGEWNGWEMPRSMVKVTNWLEKKSIGRLETTYHLRDWLISRQRYWGPPIPMVYCEACAEKGRSWFTQSQNNKKAEGMGISNFKFPISNDDWDVAGWYPAADGDLPVKLPEVKDWKPLGTGKSPLANVDSFVDTKCPECGEEARRETDVSDTFLDSAWYFFRYISTEFDDKPFDRLRVKRWLPVTMYIGGAEHSVLHLLYSRFLTMAFKDLGLCDFEEPFSRFYAHGLLVKDGAKMSKSKGNVVVPDEYIRKFGADTLRTYLMFAGPYDQGGDFRDTGIEGMSRFLKRVWTLFKNTKNLEQETDKNKEESLRMMHRTIKGLTEDLEGLRYNTAIAKLMTWYNFLSSQGSVGIEEIGVYLKLLAPFAPHMSEELWQLLRVSRVGTRSFSSIHLEEWPKYNSTYLEEDVVTVVVQVNGKMRETIKIQSSILQLSSQNKVEDLARKNERVSKYLEGKRVRKVIYVPGKVINFVID